MKKIIQSEDKNLFRVFENLVIKILRKNRFKINEVNSIYDFEAAIDDSRSLVEVKLYRAKFPKIELLKLAAYQLLSVKKEVNTKLLLIVSSYVTPSLQQEIFDETGVIVWDIKALFSLSIEQGSLYYELESVLAIAFNEAVGSFSTVEAGYLEKLINNLLLTTPSVAAKPAPNKGHILCKELHDLKPGKADAQKFEKKCTEILKYLFDNENDLALWEEQNATDGGFHKNDLLCRVISYQKTFWSELSEDFRTRYIIFEFKNYTDPITQTQIYTTEKYLFLTALRSVSIIIARNGADGNAVLATKGALKESGKLILILDLDDLCKMLGEKDKGNEPSTKIREKLDELLIKLNRH